MTPDSVRLREAVRTTFNCRCPVEYRLRAEHLRGCEWIAAVLKIYEIEREEER